MYQKGPLIFNFHILKMDLELSWHAILFIIQTNWLICRIFENGEFQGNYLKFLRVGKAIHYITDQNVREYIHKAT